MRGSKIMSLTLAVMLSLSLTVSAIQPVHKAGGALRGPANNHVDSNRGGNFGDNHRGNFVANHNDLNRGYNDLHRGPRYDRPVAYGVPVAVPVPVATPYGSFAASCNQDGADFCTESTALCPQTVFQASCVCYSDGTCATVSGTNWCNACPAGNVVSVKDGFACGAC